MEVDYGSVATAEAMDDSSQDIPFELDDAQCSRPAVPLDSQSDPLVEQLFRRPRTIGPMEQNHRDELCRIHSIDFELNKGDTLVFVDFPNGPIDKRGQIDCYGMAYRSQQVRVNSGKILATGSSKLADMLKPTYQFRIQRRRKMVNKLPEGIKYLLDLTPPSEGDELVFQMTELSLTPGIINWWRSKHLHSVDAWLVMGHDDVCTCLRETHGVYINEDRVLRETFPGASYQQGRIDPDTKLVRPTPEQLIRIKETGIAEEDQGPVYLNIPDYCPFRHCNNIIRLLMMLEGKEVVIDSASRAWTLVALAKIFDCAVVVKDSITQWLMYSYNTKFIEVLPEEALQMGYALEIEKVTQCAFRILVNELAIKEAASPESRRHLDRTTVFGRRTSHLPDELQNIVQHAARAFAERLMTTVSEIQSPNAFDRMMIPEWTDIKNMEMVLAQENDPVFEEALEMLRYIMRSIQNVIPSVIDKYLTQENLVDNTGSSGMDHDRASYVQANDYECTRDILDELNPSQRILCPFIYQDLSEKWVQDYGLGQKAIFDRVDAKTSFAQLIERFQTLLQSAMYKNPQKAMSEKFSIFFPLQRTENDKLCLRYRLIGLEALERQAKVALQPFTRSWIRHDINPSLNMTRHLLLTLNTEEMRFLPLWAGGCNDGTGGVFESFLPPAEMGPNGPGPVYHTGQTVPSVSSSYSGSLIEDLSTMRIKGSTIASSVDVHDSISTVYRQDQVIADDVSLASEAFTANANDYHEARFEVPAGHQGTGQALDMMVESVSDSDTLSLGSDGDFMSDDDESQSVQDANEEKSQDKGKGKAEGKNEKSDSDDSLVLV